MEENEDRATIVTGENDPFRSISDDQMRKIQGIFFRDVLTRIGDFSGKGLRLAHYTSAENAINIIRGGEFWMRSVRCVNDLSEVDHGHDRLLRILFGDNGPVRDRFRAAIDGSFPGATDDIFREFEEHWPTLRDQTFIACFSEHGHGNDEQFGRLSMWRSYTGGQGVALVLKAPGSSLRDLFRIRLMPVSYPSPRLLQDEILQTIVRIESESEFLRTLGREFFVKAVLEKLVMMAISMKHEVFEEEREWRMVYLPSRHPSPEVEHSVETIGGTPQIVYKIPFGRGLAKSFDGIRFPDLFMEALIGPSAFQDVIKAALVVRLREAGVPDPVSKVRATDIPLRI